MTPRFDPSAYVRDKKRKQQEIDDKIQSVALPQAQCSRPVTTGSIVGKLRKTIANLRQLKVLHVKAG